MPGKSLQLLPCLGDFSWLLLAKSRTAGLQIRRNIFRSPFDAPRCRYPVPDGFGDSLFGERQDANLNWVPETEESMLRKSTDPGNP